MTKRIYIGDLYNTVVKGDTTHLKLVLPRQLAVGAHLPDRASGPSAWITSTRTGAAATRATR
ncbi:MAG: hypothetical protein ACLU9X_14330 [Alistipes shahii]